MDKIIIICGPTATGKTGFGLQVAKKFNGEIVSADSRQVYTGMDIVTGKDLPPSLNSHISSLIWRDRLLKYYIIDGVKVWLYDVVNPNELFNVAFWKECADLVIADIYKRGKLPVVVGGTGLYINSLTQSLSQISIPPNQALRQNLSGKSSDYLFNYLNKLDSVRSAGMNSSDRLNPRRLLRAIEIALSKNSPLSQSSNILNLTSSILSIGLTAPRPELYRRVDARVTARLAAGATAEAQTLLAKYGPELPSLSGSGYHFFADPENLVDKWRYKEHADVRGQLTWFKSHPPNRWFDISTRDWQKKAIKYISDWYNKNG